MPLNLPDNPTVSQIYTDPNTGYSYLWDGQLWVSYSTLLGRPALSGSINALVGTISALNCDSIDVSGDVTAANFRSRSDGNLKQNVETVKNSLSKVTSLRGVKFDWKENNETSYGVIAQEVAEVIPELVYEDNIKTVNYNGLVGVLIEAIKDQQRSINTLQEKIQLLESK